jgi:hypothetical protein
MMMITIQLLRRFPSSFTYPIRVANSEWRWRWRTKKLILLDVIGPKFFDDDAPKKFPPPPPPSFLGGGNEKTRINSNPPAQSQTG